MKLAYKILCIDDNISSLNGVKDDFKQHNADNGIEVDFDDLPIEQTAREDDGKFLDRIASELKIKFDQNVYDIILVDLHLSRSGSDEVISGGDVIKWIRDSHTFYRPVIFYSAGIDPATDENASAQLMKCAGDHDLLGRNIMIFPRTQLTEKLKRIALDMHNEEAKINNVRGVIMDRVSEIDVGVTQSIQKLYARLPADERGKIISKISENLEERFEKLKKLIDLYKSGDLEKISSDIVSDGFSRKFDIGGRSILLYKILGSIGFLDNQTVFHRFFDKQQDPNALLHVRNDYAHKVSTNIPHDNERCKEIRLQIREQEKNMQDILNKR